MKGSARSTYMSCLLLYDDQHTHAHTPGQSDMTEPRGGHLAHRATLLVLEDRRAEDARFEAGSAGILSFMKGS